MGDLLPAPSPFNGRYNSAADAARSIFGFNDSEESHTVVRLPVHLPHRYPAFPLDAILDTPLTAYFKASADSGPLGEEARKHTYQEFPQFFVYDQSKCQWKLRQRGATLGRMCSIELTTGELFYLRTLLMVVKGAPSFRFYV